jgi:hypothetical protein
MCYFEPVMIASVVRVSEKSGRKVIVRNKSSAHRMRRSFGGAAGITCDCGETQKGTQSR